jgi:DNA repair protein RadC
METARGDTRLIDTVGAAKSLLAPFFVGARDERLYVAHLDTAQRLIGLCIRYAGKGGPVTLPVRDIIADAMRLETAGLILAHNHPSGDPRPSLTDIETTRSLARIARPIGIVIRDHLVFGGDLVVSFRQCGLL